MRRLFFILFLMITCNAFSQKSIVFSQAKFKTGDDPKWKELNFDDSQWPMIGTTIRWEEQGYKKYDGYAWYRIKFRLPLAMRNQAYWKDTLSVLLSKIDDVDESFLNGVKIGQTGLLPTDPNGPLGKWDTFRIYNIPADSKFINWDGENVIAVRAYDISNGGGMFGPMPSVKMLEPQDVVQLKLDADHVLATKYRASVKNTSVKTISGVWTISVTYGATNKLVRSIIKNIKLSPSQKLTDSINVAITNRLEVTSSFKEINTGTIQRTVKVTPYILTPAPSPKPKINSAAVFGIRPGSPFLFKVAATGKGKLHYGAVNLPQGLTLNPLTGIITGKINAAAQYHVKLSVSNLLGKANQFFTIKVGDKLALTPPMGWNSWNCWGLSVNADKVKKSAQALIDKGLIDHGWTYINIDDGWEKPQRDAEGNVVSNDKFKDMPTLGSWLHSKGLKFGIYSSPGPQTCGGYLGSYQHELQDAKTYANWGIDYLKYDWCSYEGIIGNDTSLAIYQKPYQVMQTALRAQPNDIVYSLCQYGMKDVWKWGDSVDGSSWRTTGDIKDTWESVKSIGFGHPKLYQYAKPGNWNDPDMLVVGEVGGWSGKLHKTLLSPDEQYSHISQWCLLAAPLLIGCDLSDLDNFTLNLLSNDEVLAVDQDALGKQAQQKLKTKDIEIWVKDMQDGSKVVGLFNMSETYQHIRLDFNSIGLKGTYVVRDLWRQKNTGILSGGYTSAVPPHGVTLIKLISK